MSVLVSLEGQLSPLPTQGSESCNNIAQKSQQDETELLTLLYMVFHTLSTAMRFEPANAKFFYHEVYNYSY
jgi:hypothetical protein